MYILGKGMVTHSSILAMDRAAWQAISNRLAQSRTQQKQLSTHNMCVYMYMYIYTYIYTLTIIENKMLKSPDIIVELYISPFNFSFCTL